MSAPGTLNALPESHRKTGQRCTCPGHAAKPPDSKDMEMRMETLKRSQRHRARARVRVFTAKPNAAAPSPRPLKGSRGP